MSLKTKQSVSIALAIIVSTAAFSVPASAASRQPILITLKKLGNRIVKVSEGITTGITVLETANRVATIKSDCQNMRVKWEESKGDPAIIEGLKLENQNLRQVIQFACRKR